MILAILFTPLIFLLNSFYIGKLYKRFKKDINSFSCLLFGFISFFGLIFLFITPLFLFSVDFNFIFYYLISFQVVLLIVYVLNWKWSFITYKVDYKKILIFIGFLVISILAWLLMHNFNNLSWNINISDKNLNFINQVNSIKYFDEINIISPGTNYFEYPILTYLIMFFVYSFQITNLNEIIIYISFLYLFINIILLTFIFCYLTYKDNNRWYQIVFYFGLCFCFGLFSFFFSNYLTVILCSFLLVIINFKSKESGYQRINIIVVNLLVLFAVMIDTKFILLALIINISVLSISYINKVHNATDYNFLIMFSSLLCFFISLNNKQYLGLIFLVILFVIYILYFIFKSTTFYKLMFMKIDLFLYKYIKFLIIFIAVTIFLVFFIIFFSRNDLSFYYQPWLINQSKLDLKIINSYQIRNVYLTVNIFYWLILAATLIYSIIIINKKVFKTNQRTTSMNSFILSVIFIFYNPFFMDVANQFNNLEIFSIRFDFFSIFFIIITSLFYKVIINIDYIKDISKINYVSLGCLLSEVGLLLTFSNMV